MTFEECMEKGFLNISEEEADTLLGDLFDNDDAGARLDAGLALLGTFVPKEKAAQVLDLAAVILDAHEELELFRDDDGDDDED